MAIIELTERVAVVPGGVNVGVVRAGGNQCVMVDTGLNETNAKRALKAIREEWGGAVVAILTTHGHADHFGGNAAIVKRTGARVYAPALEEAFLRYPILQTASLFGGADPPTTMRGKFLLAEASPVDEVLSAGEVDVEGVPVQSVSLAGHSPNQFGYVVDGVFFCADVVLPEQVLAKYKIPYLFSATDHLRALAVARDVACAHVVPGHGPLRDSIDDLCEMNETLLRDVLESVLDIASTPATADAILTDLLRKYEADVTDAPSYYLLHPTVFAYLSHLHRERRLDHDVRDGQSLWHAI
ncbi:MAG: MBL fold metallo-hydrolase [Thermomicrobiales bacterium]